MMEYDMVKENIVFFDRYTIRSRMLLDTLKNSGREYTGCLLEDTPYSCDDFFSVYDIFLMAYEEKKLKLKDLFFVFIDVPPYWEVRADGLNGAIYDMGEKKATIYFKEPIMNRNIHRVEWLSENGQVVRIDYYNRFGYVYCREYFNEDGKKISKSYYTSENKEVININFSNGVVCEFNDGCVCAVYTSEAELIQKMVEHISKNKKSVVLTSCNQIKQFPIKNTCQTAISLILDKNAEIEECCENRYHEKMQASLIIASSFENRLYNIREENKVHRVCYKPLVHNQIKDDISNVLVLTYSDQLFGIESFVELLPEATFHIAAPTLVSSKLLELGTKENVKIYPMITKDKVKELYDRCAFYLDINAGLEYNDAIIWANANNLLIFGYEKWLHNKDYLLEEFIFNENNLEDAICSLKNLLNNRNKYEEKAEEQNKKVTETICCIMR